MDPIGPEHGGREAETHAEVLVLDRDRSERAALGDGNRHLATHEEVRSLTAARDEGRLGEDLAEPLLVEQVEEDLEELESAEPGEPGEDLRHRRRDGVAHFVRSRQSADEASERDRVVARRNQCGRVDAELPIHGARHLRNDHLEHHLVVAADLEQVDDLRLTLDLRDHRVGERERLAELHIARHRAA